MKRLIMKGKKSESVVVTTHKMNVTSTAFKNFGEKGYKKFHRALIILIWKRIFSLSYASSILNDSLTAYVMSEGRKMDE